MKKAILVLLALGNIAYAQQRTINLGTANTVTIRGEISERSMSDAAQKLIALDEARKGRPYSIYVVLDSPGGDIDAGESFIEIAKTIKNVETITVFAASMASAIVQGLPGERSIVSSGIMMFHRAKGSVSGQFETGEMESRLEFYKRFVRRMEQRNADRMSLSLDGYKTLIKDEMWLTSEDSIARKSADNIVNVTCTKSLRNQSSTSVVTFFVFQIKVQYSNCPMLRGGQVSEQDNSKETLELYEKYKQGAINEAHGN